MENFMDNLRKKILHILFWYKLYSDDLVVIVNHQFIDEFINPLKEVSSWEYPACEPKDLINIPSQKQQEDGITTNTIYSYCWYLLLMHIANWDYGYMPEEKAHSKSKW